jgi:hypothetical protein
VTFAAAMTTFNTMTMKAVTVATVATGRARGTSTIILAHL